ncbi:MAG: glycosyltransferase [Paenibacillaceae bacterium]
MISKSMKCVVLVLAFAVALVPTRIEATGNDQVHVHVQAKQQCLSQSMVQLKGDMRKLWIDHVVWTRNYIVSAVAGASDQDKVLARLLKNQQDIGEAIKPYYGDAAGNKLAELLKEHILLAGKVLQAAKSGNQVDLAKYNKQWYANADEIAKFLSSANPNWSEKELKSLLYAHLKLVTDAVVARIKGDVDADILAFDQGEAHIIKLADILTEGIIKQFPKWFQK